MQIGGGSFPNATEEEDAQTLTLGMLIIHCSIWKEPVGLKEITGVGVVANDQPPRVTVTYVTF